MSKYAHLAALDLNKDTTAKFEIIEIRVNDVCPTLTLRPANQDNDSYFSRAMRRNAKTAKQAVTSGIGAREIQHARNTDRVLFPEFVIVGWEDMLDGKGSPIEYSQEECIEFLTHLPDWIFDEIRNFASERMNFVKEINVDDLPDAEEVEALAKNSLSG